MFLKIFFTIFFSFLLISCSNNLIDNKNDIDKKVIISPENQYFEAMVKLNSQQFDDALLIFKNIEKLYPLTNEAIQSQIMSGFINYSRMEYDSAILKFNRIINKYPSLKNLDYVYYMLAMCYYEQISHEGLDGEFNILSLESLNQVINRFPDSKYAKDSYQKIILVKSNIAAKHMTIARFYQKEKKYTAALNRYNIIVNNYSETKFTPEALYRISEIYFSIGLLEESKKTAAILGHNFPKSQWYNFSYKNLTKKNKKSIISNSMSKIFNK